VLDWLDHSPVQITALTSYPKGKAVRWNLWILDAMRDELTTCAAEREVSPRANWRSNYSRRSCVASKSHVLKM
jgi:hypothetical protein